ncbi:hypothetical protein [Sodalis-like endosymbiont of Proechinophthirus fluctus]|uniref:hypothetical protein n=1 Tax=Sodalis-like endosymbiont of Proechinophthirus fluctus TaxID=1462730 RepID=UPI001FCB8275|nr:hypothetical protein [Sodalis-like endosymbiont of Proechinophthirus fluctus]
MMYGGQIVEILPSSHLWTAPLKSLYRTRELPAPVPYRGSIQNTATAERGGQFRGEITTRLTSDSEEWYPS